MSGEFERKSIAVLIADDEPENAEAFARALRGYNVRIARRGDEALSILAEHRADIVIADQCMPGSTGALVLARARAINPLVRRMIVSASAQPHDLLQAINYGEAERYLLKPILPGTLREIVDRLAVEYLEAVRQQRHIAELQEQIQTLRRRTIDSPDGWDRLELEVARARRYKRALSLVVIEEALGDQHNIADALREVDLLVPIGRKLVVALPETGEREARLVVRRLQRDFAHATFALSTFPDGGTDLGALLASVKPPPSDGGT